uniref:Uncharacterized protein n=1 Tax=Utricularia reniformis TaxID=192314 RepID=A0A1Y0B4H9_9LAMI|nr:hypothetical protein AEK19_MT2175 [Utricularia reniformis]ART32322.1 hypothetical protein AEK19_MT2175 [Utricularia reniformis]
MVYDCSPYLKTPPVVSFERPGLFYLSLTRLVHTKITVVNLLPSSHSF